MTWKNRKRLAMVRIQLRKTLKYLLHVGFTLKKSHSHAKYTRLWDFLLFLILRKKAIFCAKSNIFQY